MHERAVQKLHWQLRRKLRTALATDHCVALDAEGQARAGVDLKKNIQRVVYQSMPRFSQPLASIGTSHNRIRTYTIGGGDRNPACTSSHTLYAIHTLYD
jgi:hypothetical protein